MQRYQPTLSSPPLPSLSPQGKAQVTPHSKEWKRVVIAADMVFSSPVIGEVGFLPPTVGGRLATPAENGMLASNTSVAACASARSGDIASAVEVALQFVDPSVSGEVAAAADATATIAAAAEGAEPKPIAADCQK